MWGEPAREIKKYFFCAQSAVAQEMALMSPVAQVLALMSANPVYGFSLMSANSWATWLMRYHSWATELMSPVAQEFALMSENPYTELALMSAKTWATGLMSAISWATALWAQKKFFFISRAGSPHIQSRSIIKNENEPCRTYLSTLNQRWNMSETYVFLRRIRRFSK